MKKFLLEILLIGFLILFLNGLYFLSIDFPRKNYVVKVNGNFSGFFVGDSHVYNFIPENKFNGSYHNFGYPSDNFTDVERKIMFLLKKKLLTEGDTVFIQTDIHLFSKYREQMNNNDISGIYNNEIRSLKNYYLPFLGERELRLRRAFKNKADNVPEFTLLTGEDSIEVVARVTKQFSDFDFDESGMNTLRDILNVLHEKKIVAIAIRYPVHPYYKKLVREKISLEKYEKEIDREFTKLNFLVLDYSEFFSADENFRDQDHLSVIGSDRLLKELRNRLYFE
jgi:hypothetical protein